MTTTTAIEPKPQKKESLYVLGLEFQALEDLLDESDGEVTEADTNVIEQWLAEYGARIEDKCAGIIAFTRDLVTKADAADSEAKRLAQLARVRRNKIERLKRYVREVFEQAGLKKIDTPLGAVRIQASGGALPVVLDPALDPRTLPEDCRKETVAPVKEAIARRLNNGEVIPGASLGERGSYLKIG
jgi:hypothetical protein